MTRRIEAVLYDNDGLLQDTEPHYEIAYNAMCREAGLPPMPDELRLGVKGVDLREVFEMFREYGLPHPDYEAFKADLDPRLFELASTAEMFPGAEGLIGELRQLGISQAVATSATTTVLERKTRRHEALYSLFAAVVPGDDPRVKKGKPHPDLLLVTAEELGVSPENCLYVGDNPSDEAAAVNADMMFIAIPGDGRPWEDFTDSNTVILESLEHVMPFIKRHLAT